MASKSPQEEKWNKWLTDALRELYPIEQYIPPEMEALVRQLEKAIQDRETRIPNSGKVSRNNKNS
ncbi:hypothetical protein [Oceanibaculum pacificum]|uniref:hypothetical protein n=1 Tax=Oceanibaculum pacificum TaxID=580166 RepID=UPI0012EDC544|nr:hypothetical protein [Oceanibaculum pacificum]